MTLARLLTLAGRALAPLLLPLGLEAQAAAKPWLSLHDFVGKEVRQQGFTLSRPQQLRIQATGAMQEGWWEAGRSLASGWILNAATREVVWQMSFPRARREGRLRVEEATLNLPAGSYEAYFANPAYRESGVFYRPVRNVDRRARKAAGLNAGDRARWHEDALQYGLDLWLADPAAGSQFEGPLRWRDLVVSLIPEADGGVLTQAFTVKKPLRLHVYAQGEDDGGGLADTAWILDAKTRTRVWEMDADKAAYGGGASKNRRQVETLTLQPGEYLACYATDDSHSPADWNAFPPCDPLLYGLLLAVAQPKDLPHLALHEPRPPEGLLAQLVQVRNRQDLSAAFTLKTEGPVRVVAMGEEDGGDFADEGWIEDAQGRRVWSMAAEKTRHAGGAAKNRMEEARVILPKGHYTLRYRTDGSHAYGQWNDDAPWDPERYGILVVQDR